MLTPYQRVTILKRGTAFIVGLSIAPLLQHGFFLLVVFHYYLPAAIIGFAFYYSYQVIRQSTLTNEKIVSVIKSTLKRNSK